MDELKNLSGIGLKDEPATDDLLNVSQYVDGLADFICVCNTPMTISIQGTWGTGKTSFMRMIQKNLEEKCICIEFNTWQFSQFNLEDKLQLVMLKKLVEDITDNKDEDNKPNKFFRIKDEKKADAIKDAGKKFLDILAAGANIGAGFLSQGGTGDDFVQKLFSSDDIKKIDKLSKAFEELVRKRTEDSGKRMVFFIDDLDRLDPRKAVEILEVLKNFLDSENCVFVLAIDYDVVVKGVAAKYGMTGDEKQNNDKGKQFFDKIIQVPFQMPVARYDIEKFVESCFDGIELSSKPSKRDLEKYSSLIRYSIGRNPRSMKRLFNSFQLLNKVTADKITNNSKRQAILFAFLCMQLKYEAFYQYLLSNPNDVDAAFINGLTDSEDTSFFTKLNMGEKEVNNFSCFISTLINILDSDGSGELDEKEILPFKEVLAESTLTNAQDNDIEDKPAREKKKYSYKGQVYTSGSRSMSIGRLGLDIVKNIAAEKNWGRQDAEEFIEVIKDKLNTSWLREVFIFQEDVLQLESIPGYFEKGYDYEYRRNEQGQKICASIQEFSDHFFSYLLDISDKTENESFDIDHPDSYAIKLSDGEVLYVAKFWGEPDINKLVENALNMYGMVVEVEKVTMAYHSFVYKNIVYKSGTFSETPLRNLARAMFENEILVESKDWNKDKFDEFLRTAVDGSKRGVVSLIERLFSYTGGEGFQEQPIVLGDNTSVYMRFSINANDINMLVELFNKKFGKNIVCEQIG